MMTPQTETSADDSAAAREWRAWCYLGGRRALVILAIIVVIAGTALGWSWLVAAGVAPVLLSILPCLVMCGLGLCMNGLAGRSCGTSSSQHAANPGSRTTIVPVLDQATVDVAEGPVRDHDGGDAAERPRDGTAEIVKPEKETEHAING